MSGKVGIIARRPNNATQWGIQFDEAIQEKLRQEWFHYLRQGDPFLTSYYPQIEVLNKLQKLISLENNMTFEEAFALFVKAKHNPNDFRNSEDNNKPTNESSYPFTLELVSSALNVINKTMDPNKTD